MTHHSLGLWWRMKELVVIAVGLWLPFPSTFSAPDTAKDFGGFSFHPPGRGWGRCCRCPPSHRSGVACPWMQRRSRRKDRSSQVLWGFIRIPSMGPAGLLQRDGDLCTQGPLEAAQRCPASISALSSGTSLSSVICLPGSQTGGQGPHIPASFPRHTTVAS